MAFEIQLQHVADPDIASRWLELLRAQARQPDGRLIGGGVGAYASIWDKSNLPDLSTALRAEKALSPKGVFSRLDLSIPDDYMAKLRNLTPVALPQRLARAVDDFLSARRSQGAYVVHNRDGRPSVTMVLTPTDTRGQRSPILRNEDLPQLEQEWRHQLDRSFFIDRTGPAVQPDRRLTSPSPLDRRQALRDAERILDVTRKLNDQGRVDQRRLDHATLAVIHAQDACRQLPSAPGDTQPIPLSVVTVRVADTRQYFEALTPDDMRRIAGAAALRALQTDAHDGRFHCLPHYQGKDLLISVFVRHDDQLRGRPVVDIRQIHDQLINRLPNILSDLAQRHHPEAVRPHVPSVTPIRTLEQPAKVQQPDVGLSRPQTSQEHDQEVLDPAIIAPVPDWIREPHRPVRFYLPDAAPVYAQFSLQQREQLLAQTIATTFPEIQAAHLRPHFFAETEGRALRVTLLLPEKAAIPPERLTAGADLPFQRAFYDAAQRRGATVPPPQQQPPALDAPTRDAIPAGQTKAQAQPGAAALCTQAPDITQPLPGIASAAANQTTRTLGFAGEAASRTLAVGSEIGNTVRQLQNISEDPARVVAAKAHQAFDLLTKAAPTPVRLAISAARSIETLRR